MKTNFLQSDENVIEKAKGALALLLPSGSMLSPFGQAVDEKTAGHLARLQEADRRRSAARARARREGGAGQGSADDETADAPKIDRIPCPHGLRADRLLVARWPEGRTKACLRNLGGALAVALGEKGGTLLIDAPDGEEEGGLLAEVLFGLSLRAYRFDTYFRKKGARGKLDVFCKDPARARDAFAALKAVADSVGFARDLVNEPANVLTTKEFARRIASLSSLGVKVEILGEKSLKALEMRALLAVGRGSASKSRVGIMRWQGGKRGARPLVLIGKGVVFDAGGISLKPAAGMEEMTTDMGGAALVCAAVRAAAARKAKANIVGLVGLVENMPDGRAHRPGDIVRAMSGATIEIINTDAEGRLVLADLLHYAQTKLSPAAMIDFATLTGAIIVALGFEKAGLFSNDDTLAAQLLQAAGEESEGLWRMPLDPQYDKALKSRLADMKNVGGRGAGAVTAAQFLKRFVKKGGRAPWAHVDIAGVALHKTARPLSPKGASGWGVATINRFIATHFEKS